ncbi:universal stress protein [Natrinema salifodinae]|uniref:Nucleotide-binding universal stress protein, UspA family n=1 Tax=Natrinema salifodinae TaxID=1202768 RepID=A0A1I0PRY2_9EURY|nr:universal stress protein [Natrinema salifodinae]SEW17102.1 Nucleotide-binding universal stress protein, UspA family [Natrinema salifodinae]
MYRVLMPVDTEEDRALAQAEYVASLPDAADAVEAYVLFVFTEDSEDLPQEFETFKSASRIASVRRAAERLEEAGVEVTVLEDSGDTEVDILDEAAAYDVDSIVLGGRKRSPVGKAIFGSVTQGIILTSERPVVVTGSES